MAVAPLRSPQQESRGDRRGDRSPRGPRGDLRNKNQVVEDGILEWSRSEEPLSDRGNTYTIDKILVQPRNTWFQYF